jgi:hypothetical protein
MSWLPETAGHNKRLRGRDGMLAMTDRYKNYLTRVSKHKGKSVNLPAGVEGTGVVYCKEAQRVIVKDSYFTVENC